MAGAGEAYHHVPFFYSDLFDLGYEAVGEVDSRHRTVAEWSDEFRSGVVAYVDSDDRPRGMLLWGMFGKVEPATGILRGGGPLDRDLLRALLD
jgi:hypothetical protein